MHIIASLVLATTLFSPLAVNNSAMAQNEDRMEQRQELQMLREEAKLERERKREQNREELRLKLQEIRDERKARIVSNIDERIASVNDKWVEHWNNALQRLSGILAKIEERAGAANAAGTDTSAVDAAVADAREAIDVAQTAVDAQADKTYIISVVDDATLGQAVRSTIARFHNDLKLVKETVQEAKKAVVSALVNLKGVSGEHRGDNQEDATESSTIEN